jgi:hypothetical protein
VCGIAALLIAALLVLRHRRWRTKDQPNPTPDKELVGDQGPYEADGKSHYLEADGQTRVELASPIPELANQTASGIRRKPVQSSEIHELPGSTEPSSQIGSSQTDMQTGDVTGKSDHEPQSQ